MSTVYRLHGEIGGAVLAAGGSMADALSAEGITTVSLTTRMTFGSSTPDPPKDVHGNGGKYYLEGTSSGGVTVAAPFGDTIGTNVPEGMIRMSLYWTTGGSSSNSFFMIVRENMSGSNDYMFRFLLTPALGVTINARMGTTTSQIGTMGDLGTNGWKTLWVYYRLGTPNGTAINNDGHLAVYTTDPHSAGASPAFSSTAGYGYKASNAATPVLAVGRHDVRDLRTGRCVDDLVTHAPSLDFVSADQALPATGSVFKYTDGSGNVITARIANVHNTGPNGSGNATATLLLTHMDYTPSGGSVVTYNGLKWGSVTTPWGAPGASVAITNISGAALGTGKYDYARSVFPKTGYFMPVAIPKSTRSTVGLTKSNANITEDAALATIGGPASEANYLVADAANENWRGEMDGKDVTGTDALNIVGTVTIERVETYVWARTSGTGAAIDGLMAHFNLPQSVSGTNIGNKYDALPLVALPSAYGVSIREHFVGSDGDGTVSPWTVATVNAGNFGVWFK